MTDDYARLKRIQGRNDLILGHFVHTWQRRLADDTLYQHVLNIQRFTGGHLNYSRTASELRSVDQITAGDVYNFITEWLPRKSWVNSERRIKSYLASIRKYVQFMAEYGYMPADVAADILRTLKEEREAMIRAAVTYDESAEDESPEAFRARLKDLEARWAALSPRKGH
jgi:site-specific recombinase XerD